MKKIKLLFVTFIVFVLVVGTLVLFINQKEYMESIQNMESINTLNVEQQNEYVICIDAGHQAKGDSSLESIGPGSNAKKARVSSGTSGISTKKNEYEVNLEAALILKDILINKGYKVIMTRETHNVNISNAERAQIANVNNANMTIRLHCDSIKDSSKSGASILVPNKNNKYSPYIYEPSFKYAKNIKEQFSNNGIKVLGIFERNDITGFNWSKGPVVIVEMGFMSNYNEDKMLSNKTYITKMMTSLSDALNNYFNKQS